MVKFDFNQDAFDVISYILLKILKIFSEELSLIIRALFLIILLFCRITGFKYIVMQASVQVMGLSASRTIVNKNILQCVKYFIHGSSRKLHQSSRNLSPLQNVQFND